MRITADRTAQLAVPLSYCAADPSVGVAAVFRTNAALAAAGARSSSPPLLTK